MTPKGADLEATDLIEVSTIESGSYVTRSITGQELIDAIPLPPTGLTVGTTPISSGTNGRVLFQGTGNVLQQSGNLFWDSTNNRLGIGTSTPSQTLDVVGVAKFNLSGTSVILNNPSGRYTDLAFANADSIKSFVSLDNSQFYLDLFNSSNYGLRFWTNNAERMRIPTTGNVLINTTTDAGFRLDVNGTARVSGNMFVNSGSSTSVGLSIGDSTTASFLSYFSGGLYFKVTNANAMVLTAGTNGGLIIGASGSQNTASARLQVDSTTQGFLPPRMTTTQKNAIASPAAGLVVYDNTDNKHYGYNGTTWNAFY